MVGWHHRDPSFEGSLPTTPRTLHMQVEGVGSRRMVRRIPQKLVARCAKPITIYYGNIIAGQTVGHRSKKLSLSTWTIYIDFGALNTGPFQRSLMDCPAAYPLHSIYSRPRCGGFDFKPDILEQLELKR